VREKIKYKEQIQNKLVIIEEVLGANLVPALCWTRYLAYLYKCTTPELEK